MNKNDLVGDHLNVMEAVLARFGYVSAFWAINLAVGAKENIFGIELYCIGPCSRKEALEQVTFVEEFTNTPIEPPPISGAGYWLKMGRLQN